MVSSFLNFWNTLEAIVSAMPGEITTVVSFVFCGVCIIGMLRSL